jgi:prevent-host-death family protein
MDAKHTLSITEARKRIFDIAEKVQEDGVHYILTEKGRPKAVIMSADELESWRETIDILVHHPTILDDIKWAEKEYKEGKTIPLEELLVQYGYVVNDKGKLSYVAPRRRKRRTKKAG